MSALRSFVGLAVLLAGHTNAAIGPVTDLTISNGQVSPDGYTRDAVLAGGVYPGPLITGNKGDNFQINVVDNLTESSMLKTTSIHWHGMFQKGTNWADGPAFVNQCPIASGDSFLYDFTAADQAGTFWYHSHLGAQYCDGLRGPMVVYDPDDPHASLYDVDDETTILTLSDWYHTVAPAANTFPTADSTLFNGVGRYTDGPAVSFYSLNVESGKRYRVRLISLSCDPNYTFSIDGHNMIIIEADGVNTEPLTVDQIQIFAGQRYSFILTADQNVDNYWIRANPDLGSTGYAGGINLAVLRYSGANDTDPTSDPTTDAPTITAALNEGDLVPLENAGAPGTAGDDGVDLAMNLAFAFDFTTLTLSVNGVSFVPPTIPVLLQIMSGAQSATDLLPSGSVYTLPGNSTIQLSFPAGVAGGPHPLHLHGHVFDVVRVAGSSTYNYINPPRRDVVNIGAAGDNVTIRFTTDNSGPWFLHCHIDWHLELGFAVVFAEDAADTVSSNPTPDAWDQLCTTYDALSDDDH